MAAKSGTLIALTFILTIAGGNTLQAEAIIYKPIGSNDARRLAEGERVETRGHLWISSNGVFLNFNQPSAQVPTGIDIANVTADTVSRLKTECSARDQFDGGCNALVRGQIGRVGKEKGIIAHEIEVLPKQK